MGRITPYFQNIDRNDLYDNLNVQTRVTVADTEYENDTKWLIFNGRNDVTYRHLYYLQTQGILRRLQGMDDATEIPVWGAFNALGKHFHWQHIRLLLDFDLVVLLSGRRNPESLEISGGGARLRLQDKGRRVLAAEFDTCLCVARLTDFSFGKDIRAE